MTKEEMENVVGEATSIIKEKLGAGDTAYVILVRHKDLTSTCCAIYGDELELLDIATSGCETVLRRIKESGSPIVQIALKVLAWQAMTMMTGEMEKNNEEEEEWKGKETTH